MKIFLTGGTGLVGSHSITALAAAGHTIQCTVRTEAGAAFVRKLGAKPVHGLVQDPGTWRSVDADAIVHAAAILPGSGEREAFEIVNVAATRLAGETASRIGVRLVHLSSVAVYGSAGYGSGPGPFDEDTPFADHSPEDRYGRSKRAAEAALWDAMDTRPENAVALRPCVIYGEHDRLFVPRILAAMRFGLWPVSGSGTNSLAVVYAGNVAAAVVAALEHPQASGAFNVTNDGTISQREFFTQLADAAGKRLKVVPLPGVIADSIAHTVHLGMTAAGKRGFGDLPVVAARWLRRDNPYSSDRARHELGWRPTTAPREAVVRTGGWFASNQGGPT